MRIRMWKTSRGGALGLLGRENPCSRGALRFDAPYAEGSQGADLGIRRKRLGFRRQGAARSGKTPGRAGGFKTGAHMMIKVFKEMNGAAQGAGGGRSSLMADPETVIDPCRPPLCGKPPLLALSFPGGFPETPARARLSISTSHVFAPRTPLTWPDGALCGRRWFRIGRRRLHRPSSGWMRRNGGSYDDEDIQRNERHGARGGERRSGTRGSDAAAGLPERLSVPFGASSRVAPLARAETRLHELL